MTLFLLISFPLYLAITLARLGRCRFVWSRVVQRIGQGLLCFVLFTIFFSFMPVKTYFAWRIPDIFFSALWGTREGALRLAVCLVPAVWLFSQYRKEGRFGLGREELLCFLAGYFSVYNGYDFLLINSYSGINELVITPLSRILFSLLLAYSFELLQRRGKARLSGALCLIGAYVVPNFIVALSIFFSLPILSVSLFSIALLALNWECFIPGNNPFLVQSRRGF